MLSAQLITAFLVDWVLDDAAPTLGTVAGAVLIVLAVALVARSRVRAPDPPGVRPSTAGR
jgi:drug/metabolite transporter (DMT)-like permease